MLNSHLGSQLGAPLEYEMDRMGRKAWVNPVYSGSPPLSPLNISTVYRPGGPLQNPYEGKRAQVPPTEDPNGGTSTPGTQENVKVDSEGLNQNEKGKSSGCCAYICRGICGLWGTTLTMNTNQNKELLIKTSLRELLVYIMFLVDLCLLTYGMSSSSAFYYTNMMAGLFLNTPTANGVTFQSISSMNDFWNYVQGPMLDGLYWTTWYNNQPLQTGTYSFITYDNLLLGVPRMRQIKVKNNSCTIFKDFQKEITGCYDVYDPQKEDDLPFSLVNGTAWTYHTQEELHGSPHWGLLATYSGGGYYQDLWLTRNETAAALQELMNNLWLDRGTRVVFIDFSTYNANINLFCVIRLVVEFPATGGAIPSYQFRTVKLIRYIGNWDYFVMGCEAVFCIFIFYYIVEEILELRIHKLSYFSSVWNILDIVIIVLSIIAIGFNIFRTVKVNSLVGSLLKQPNMYVDMEFLAFWQTQYNNMNAVNLFFAWIKIFKYISFNKTMNQLSSTLGRCAKDIMGFAVMFFIVFFGYAQLGYLLFGTQVQSFSTFTKCIFTQFRIILGDFDFDAIDTANRVLGPIYFVTFVFFVFFVLLNMFLAIINDTYSEVKEELSNQKDEFHFSDIIKQSYLKTFMKLTHRKEKITDIQKALQSGTTELEYKDFRDTLKEMGHTDNEISEAFNKFDKDGNHILDQEEQNKMKQELKEKRDALNAELQNLGRSCGDNRPDNDNVKISPVSQEEFQMLVRQVLQLERSMATVMSNMKQECQDRIGNNEDKREDARASPNSHVLGNIDAEGRERMALLENILLGRRIGSQKSQFPQTGWSVPRDINSKGQPNPQL